MAATRKVDSRTLLPQEKKHEKTTLKLAPFPDEMSLAPSASSFTPVFSSPFPPLDDPRCRPFWTFSAFVKSPSFPFLNHPKLGLGFASRDRGLLALSPFSHLLSLVSRARFPLLGVGSCSSGLFYSYRLPVFRVYIPTRM